MPEHKDPKGKVYWTIGEVAKELDVTPSLLRHWEKEFPDIRPKKNRKGNRMYMRKDIDNIRMIYMLVKEQGMTLQGAKKALRKKKGKVESRVEAIQILEELKGFLEELHGSFK